MITLCPANQCSGCAACLNSCPSGCIEMRRDAEGFLFPHIDMERCTQCRLCQRACPVLTTPEVERDPSPEAFACWHNDENIRSQSSSGGMFTAFADHILDQNGVVFGALLDDAQRLKHAAVSSKEELGRLRKSKYFQSDVSHSFREVKAYLEQGRWVLFTGTPCQVAGLYGFLGGRSYATLLTADIVCHGVPSALVFEKYQEFQERRNNSPMETLCFRDKRVAWSRPELLIRFKNGREYRKDFITEDPYSRAFLANICLRQSCHRCPHATVKRYGDITLADFWGIGKAEPFEYGVDQGVSLVLLNSEPGRRAFEAARSAFFAQQRPLSEAVAGNVNLRMPTPPHPDRALFFAGLHQLPFGKLVDRYVPRTARFKSQLKKLLGPKLLDFIRDIRGRSTK